MSKRLKQIVVGSMAVSALVVLAALIDMVAGVPFSNQMMMDIMFVVAGGLVIYMGYDAIKDLS